MLISLLCKWFRPSYPRNTNHGIVPSNHGILRSEKSELRCYPSGPSGKGTYLSLLRGDSVLRTNGWMLIFHWPDITRYKDPS